MKHGLLRMFFLLTVALATCAAVHAQSQPLGDVAKELRAERSGQPKLKVYTNDDIATPKPPAPASREEEASAEAGSELPDAAEKSDKVAPAKEGEAAGAAKEKKREAKSEESETDKRSREINQKYLDRIAQLKEKISAAQAEIDKLQRRQVESAIDYRRSEGTSPSAPLYAEEQRTLAEQIESQRTLIESLNSQLEDAKEAARHAGVPHATD
jgi:DNA repair exonuclease SbcCD ATPase subunit